MYHRYDVPLYTAFVVSLSGIIAGGGFFKRTVEIDGEPVIDFPVPYMRSRCYCGRRFISLLGRLPDILHGRSDWSRVWFNDEYMPSFYADRLDMTERERWEAGHGIYDKEKGRINSLMSNLVRQTEQVQLEFVLKCHKSRWSQRRMGVFLRKTSNSAHVLSVKCWAISET